MKPIALAAATAALLVAAASANAQTQTQTQDRTRTQTQDQTQSQTQTPTGPGGMMGHGRGGMMGRGQGGMGRGMGGGMGGGMMGPQNTYGWSMMTPAERQAHMARMHSFTNRKECEAYVAQHHQLMMERARARGMAMPAQPRMDPCAGLK